MKKSICNTIRTHLLILSIITLSIGQVRADTTDVNFSFPVPNPQNITINIGDTVRWSGPSSVHPLQQVTGADSDTPTSGGFSSTASPFSFVFQSPGVFYYRCTNHGVAALNGTMRGSVTVQQAVNPTPTNNPDPNPTAVPTAPGGSTDDCQSKPSTATLVSPASGAVVSTSKVTLDWEETECASTYRVVLRKAKKSGLVVESKTTTKSQYKSKKLEAHQTYFWSVKACNTKGCSSAAASKFSRQ